MTTPTSAPVSSRASMLRSSAFMFMLLALFGGLLAGPVQATEWSEILPEQSQVKKIAGGFKFTEGPAWHPQGFLLFTDIPNGRVIKLADDGTLSDFFTPSGRCNGLMCDQAGFVYACQMGQGHVLKLNADGELLGMLAAEYDGKIFNGPNDLAIDSTGGMYFTDPYYGPEKPLPQPMMAVYYITPSGTVSRIIEDRERPNGVTISPDGKTLYVAEPNRGEVYSYEITEPGKVSSGKLIFKGEQQLDGSGPDGMTHDVAGNLYCTYNGIVVLNPAGELLGRIATPEKPSNCTFGGAENKTLYITARTGLYEIELGQAGIALKASGPKLSQQQTSSPNKKMVDSNIQTVAFVAQAAEETKTNDVKAGDLLLEVPVDWDSQPPSNNLRLAQFKIPNAKGETAAAELVVFPPFGGSVNDNIGRWIKQFDPQGIELKLRQGTTDQGNYYLVDVAGTYKKPDGPPFLRKTIDAPDHRMVAVILAVENKGNYFLKMVGPEKTIAAAVDSFRASFGADAETEKEYKME